MAKKSNNKAIQNTRINNMANSFGKRMDELNKNKKVRVEKTNNFFGIVLSLVLMGLALHSEADKMFYVFSWASIATAIWPIVFGFVKAKRKNEKYNFKDKFAITNYVIIALCLLIIIERFFNLGIR